MKSKSGWNGTENRVRNKIEKSMHIDSDAAFLSKIGSYRILQWLYKLLNKLLKISKGKWSNGKSTKREYLTERAEKERNGALSRSYYKISKNIIKHPKNVIKYPKNIMKYPKNVIRYPKNIIK